jgi:hypothetical protein
MARDQCLLCGELTDGLLSSVPVYVAVQAATKAGLIEKVSVIC